MKTSFAAVALLLTSLALSACGGPEGPMSAEEEALDAVETSQSELVAQPFCQTTSETEEKYDPCGLEFDSDGNPHTIYEHCEQTCTTRRRLVFTPNGSECQVKPTICTQWICGACGGD